MTTVTSGSRAQSQKPAIRLATLLLGTGIAHLVVPGVYDPTIPRQLPGKARTYTYMSGVAELAIAGAIAVPRTRRLGAGLAAVLFAAVFPANIQMAIDWMRRDDMPGWLKAVAALRLPLQIPLITQALTARRNAP